MDYISRIRRFNRFYNRVNGINNEYTDLTAFSATEAHVLYEIGIQEHPTASTLSNYFDLDKGYLSRIIKKLVKKGLIKRNYLESDKRVFILELTQEGKEQVNTLISLSGKIVKNKIKNIPSEELDKVIEAMEYIETTLSKYY
ncbi:MarR family transcriptional regulator [Sporolactobacillus sp. THM7-4]|nr:MarR family transcriptional regulator [Sporolactobacillus sp. THM7-4]